MFCGSLDCIKLSQCGIRGLSVKNNIMLSNLIIYMAVCLLMPDTYSLFIQLVLEVYCLYSYYYLDTLIIILWYRWPCQPKQPVDVDIRLLYSALDQIVGSLSCLVEVNQGLPNMLCRRLCCCFCVSSVPQTWFFVAVLVMRKWLYTEVWQLDKT